MIYRYFYNVIIMCIGLGLFFSLAGQKKALAMSQTQQLDPSVIDEYVTEQMTVLEIPGVAIGIVRGDQIEYMQGYGIADDTGRAMTPQTPFLVASFSKSITALGVMQLVDEGKIELDAPVQTYLPWFQVADAEYSPQITVRHLLNQTSGFSELEGDKRNLDKNFADDALENSIRELKSASLNSLPGTSFEYSNTNYDILVVCQS
jgi:CubicO group peptidase (beta-lactamase class C family)